MTNILKTVSVPGDNTHTVEDLMSILNRLPYDAKVKTKDRAGSDAEIVIWWVDEL